MAGAAAPEHMRTYEVHQRKEGDDEHAVQEDVVLEEQAEELQVAHL